jgi:hypothetical protein
MFYKKNKKTKERERERERERDTPVSLHISDMIEFSISHL